MSRRFNALATDIRRSFGVNQALSVNSSILPLYFDISSNIITHTAASRGQFDFPTSTEKVAAFETWLRNQIDSGILETVIRRIGGNQVFRHWQNDFLRNTYVRSVQDTERALNSLGQLIAPMASVQTGIEQGVHVDTLRLMYSRAFEQLRGITEAMSSAMSQVFSLALIEGVGPKEIARRLVNQIGLAKGRALVMARTEVIRTYSEARLNTMEQNSIQGVTADVEFLTAGDSRVCSKCKSLEGNTYTIQEARGVIPVHPRCRCTWLPANIEVASDVAA